MRRIQQSRTLVSTLLRPISTSAATPPPPSSAVATTPTARAQAPLVLPRARTPSEKQFESWVTKLKPGFSPSDVDGALKAQSDPDLAFDIFRWTAQRSHYKHTHETYLTMIQISVSAHRFAVAVTLIDEVLAGACTPHPSLYNFMIKFCCKRKPLRYRAFDVYKKMYKSDNCKPTLETYTFLFASLLRDFGKLPVSHLYLHPVRSLAKQMKYCGVIPDTFVSNYIIKAYSICLHVDEALKVLREMALYGCHPNAYTYNYIIRTACHKERLDLGFSLFKEMKEKCLKPRPDTYMILVCSLAMEERFDEAIELLFDMLDKSFSPDILTYKTLLDQMCRNGRVDEAFDLVEQFKLRDCRMNGTIHNTLLNTLR